MIYAWSPSHSPFLTFFFSLIKSVLSCLRVYRPGFLVIRKVPQYMILVGHQYFRRKTRKNGKDIWLRFPNYYKFRSIKRV